jgi:hypothetical protein
VYWGSSSVEQAVKILPTHHFTQAGDYCFSSIDSRQVDLGADTDVLNMDPSNNFHRISIHEN